MTTYYCHSLEEVLKRTKAAGKKPGCRYGGIVLKSGKKGFAIYRDGVVIEQYSVIGVAMMKMRNDKERDMLSFKMRKMYLCDV